jgi:hypothetical protein
VQTSEIANPLEQSPSSFADTALVIESHDQFSLRLSQFEDGLIRGVQMHIENHRLASIQPNRIVLSSACSFDGQRRAFREACLTDQIFSRPEAIRPSCSSIPIRLVWKAPQSAELVTGENNFLRRLLWPDMDKAGVERWRLDLSVSASERPMKATEQAVPLNVLRAEVTVLWTKSQNEFKLEGVLPAPAPPTSSVSFPLEGKDGTKRVIVRYIMHGEDRLLAYTTTRENLPGTRFLVVRERPGREPQSIQAPDRDAANAQWNEWYQEWRKGGFGGASGNGLDGASPF